MGGPIIVSIMMTQLTELNNFEKSLLGFALTLGVFIGCIVFPYLSDKYGRAYAFKRTILIASVGFLLLTLSPSYYGILLCLVGVGVGLGGEMTIYGTVMIESSPPSQKGAVTLLTLAGSIGVAGFVSFIIMLELTWPFAIAKWRVMGVLLTLFNIVAIGYRMAMHESPMFLYEKGNMEYKKIIEHIAHTNGRNLQENIQNLLEAGEEPSIIDTNKLQQAESNLSKIMSGSNLYTTVCLTAAHSIGNFAATGLTLLQPLFLPVKTQMGIYIIILVQQFCGVPGMYFASKLIETRLGRRWTTAIGYWGTALFLSPFIFSGGTVSIYISTLLYYMMLQWATAGILTITPESYPPNIRVSGVGFVTSISRITGLISPPLSGILLDTVGVPFTISVYFLCFLLQGTFIALLRETRPIKKYHIL